MLGAAAQNCEQNRLHEKTDPIQNCILNEFHLEKLKSNFFDQFENLEKMDYLTYMQFHYHRKFSSSRAISFLIWLLGMADSKWLIFSVLLGFFQSFLQDFLRLNIVRK